MQNALRKFLLLSCTFLASTASAAGPPPRVSKLLVVPVADKNSSRFDAAVTDMVSKPLGRFVQVLPGSALTAALKARGIRLKVRSAAVDAVDLGRAAEASHMLLVLLDKNTVRISLVELPDGNTLLARRYPGRKLSQSSASNIVQAVKGAFATNAVSTLARKGDARVSEEVEEPVPEEPEAAAEAPSTADAEAVAEPASGERAPGWRTAGRIGLGFMLMQRQANLASKGLTLPCYCAAGNNSNPFFAAGHAYGEIYPGAFAGDGTHWWEGLGIFAEVAATRVQSYGADGKLSANTVLDLRGGLAMRYVFWNSEVAPDLSLVVGYGSYSFPLKNSQFPSLSYAAPLLGLNASIPLGIPDLALLLGGSYSFLGKGSGSALGQQQSATAFQVRGGLRIRLEPFEISAMYRYALYTVNYKNASVQLTDASMRTANVKLTDGLGELTLSGGVAF